MNANRLAGEKSPYLLQHKDNPVDWHPWGEAAFAEAKRRNLPVFLSIGYSTCHWCHVMAHESFENPEIARLMNDNFINIKVDREERPDVDRVYMAFVQASTGGGGWPMSVWLTPEGKPFFGGTYFPPEDRYGRAGFPNVLQQISRLWQADRGRVEQEGERVMTTLRESVQGPGEGELSDGKKVLDSGFEQFSRSYDAEEGGFGGAPKFPRASVFNFLLRYGASADPERSRRAQGMIFHTLRKMAGGGIRDHLGGGFHRYSVDEFWHVPHFEKMLYDQSQVAISYVEAWQITGEPFYEEIARETLDYVLRDMTHRDGGFYSAEDADSLITEGSPAHAEGVFYVWTRKEIFDVLGERDGQIFCRHYGVEEAGNAPPGSDPHGEFQGKNILIERQSAADIAKLLGLDESEVAASLRSGRTRLFERRTGRPRPHLDDKILAAWNGLMVSAFARAGAAFGELRYVEAARRAADFLKSGLMSEGKLLRSWRDGPGEIPGFAEDYAFLIQGLLDLYTATFETRWLVWARELQSAQDELFWDEHGGSYFSSAEGDPLVPVRMKEDYDGAEPSVNSISAINLLRLGRLLHEENFERRARRVIASLNLALERAPTAVPQMLAALDLSLRPPAQVVIAGDVGAKDTRALERVFHRAFLPHAVLLRADKEFFAGSAVAGMTPRNGRAAAYVCENFACQAPVTNAEELAMNLKTTNLIYKR